MPFISREMNRLKLVKKIELKKNKSMFDFQLNNMEEKQNIKRRKFCKIYRYYFSKDKIDEILMNQKIKKLKQDLNEKQVKEKNEYNDTFHKNYPFENENDYIKEMKDIIKNEKVKENLEKIKKNFLEKKHEEYINKMGIEFQKGFNILNKKFLKEKEEQNIKIKKIILNRQIKQFEKSNEKNKNNIDNKNNKKHFYFSQFNFYGIEPYDKNENKKEKEKEKTLKKKLGSKIFSFKARGTLYKTIII